MLPGEFGGGHVHCRTQPIRVQWKRVVVHRCQIFEAGGGGNGIAQHQLLIHQHGSRARMVDEGHARTAARGDTELLQPRDRVANTGIGEAACLQNQYGGLVLVRPDWPVVRFPEPQVAEQEFLGALQLPAFRQLFGKSTSEPWVRRSSAPFCE